MTLRPYVSTIVVPGPFGHYVVFHWFCKGVIVWGLWGPRGSRYYWETPRLPLKGSLKGDIDLGIDADIVPHY